AHREASRRTGRSSRVVCPFRLGCGHGELSVTLHLDAGSVPVLVPLVSELGRPSGMLAHGRARCGPAWTAWHSRGRGSTPTARSTVSAPVVKAGRDLTRRRHGLGLFDRTRIPEEARLGGALLPRGGGTARVRVSLRGPLEGPEDQGAGEGPS